MLHVWVVTEATVHREHGRKTVGAEGNASPVPLVAEGGGSHEERVKLQHGHGQSGGR